MELNIKRLKLSEAQIAFMRGVSGEKGLYVPRYPSNRTGGALAKKGLVAFHWGVNRWVLTFEGERIIEMIRVMRGPICNKGGAA
ncbi:hypothetical protein FEM41_02015 [Jejubacter calystegiae]|uniref:Uncharacterized protein n=1 Tax=Jejubacter calystegiae TaxID=2579935 RepID=A0A4P8YDF3_9ENTR|nr:hypothetical protein [Jejubacter calystegiae]QCT18500.1 hypothetical protein FEM41_02015 [Jejubacter calystegiae]